MSSSLKMLGKENVNGNALKEINTNIQKLSLKEDVKAKVTYERVTCFGGKVTLPDLRCFVFVRNAGLEQ